MADRPLSLVRDTGNPELDKALGKLERYDFTTITKSCVDRYGWETGRAENAEIEAKQFFALAFLDSGHYHIPSPDVDEYWHRMILHTVWYNKFGTYTAD